MTRRLLILDTVLDVVLRTAVVFALFLLFSGHNAPGGGFIAGLVVGICLVLQFIASGSESMTTRLPLRPDQFLGIGLLMAVLVGVAGLSWGSSFLESDYFQMEVPLLGAVKASSALVFDIGVFLVVVGLTAALITAVGDDEVAA